MAVLEDIHQETVHINKLNAIFSHLYPRFQAVISIDASHKV